MSFFVLFFRGFVVTLLYGKINSEKHLEKCEHSYLAPTQIGIMKVSTNPPAHVLALPAQTKQLLTRFFWLILQGQENI